MEVAVAVVLAKVRVLIERLSLVPARITPIAGVPNIFNSEQRVSIPFVVIASVLPPSRARLRATILTPAACNFLDKTCGHILYKPTGPASGLVKESPVTAKNVLVIIYPRRRCN